MNRSHVSECLILKNAEIPTPFIRENRESHLAPKAPASRGFGGMPPPREILNFSLSEMRFAAFSGPFGNFFSS